MGAPSYPHITLDPAMCGGTACIGGRRIRVFDVAMAYEFEALSVEEICAMHPGLTLAEAHAALTYFYDHRDAIIAEVEREDDAIRAFQANSSNQGA